MKQHALRKQFRTPFDYCLLILIVLLAMSQVMLVNYRKCIIEGQSMNDTLIGRDSIFDPVVDCVVLTKTWSKIGYKDIIVFIEPDNLAYEPLIKRVIAIEGETIKFMRDSQSDVITLYKLVGVNEWQLVHEDYIKNGVMHRKSAFTITYGEAIVIPNNHVFVMGDNRDDSRDSRTFGTVSVDSIVGKIVGGKTLGAQFDLIRYSTIYFNFIAVILYVVVLKLVPRSMLVSSISNFTNQTD